jgi:dihydrofolate reductase
VRPLRYSINVTLDGCCDHRAGVPDEELHRHATESIARADALLFGRVTYEMMEAAWRPPGAMEGMPGWMEPFGRTIDAAKKYVVSSTLEQVDWNAELLRGDLENAVRELKREPGDGLFVGGVKLPMALAELGLIDEYEFVVQPRLVGHGPTLFAGLAERVELRLVGTREFGSGAVAMRYEPAGSDPARELAEIEESHRADALANVSLLEEVAAGIAAGDLDPRLREEARSAIHRLRGSFGVFGFERAGRVAESVGKVLAGDEPIPAEKAAEVSRAASAMRTELEHPPLRGRMEP